MEQLIPIASKLQDVLGALGQNSNLDLPQIVVVGGQSSGKSSVLESLVGRSFLPRGTGIVTRRPLILQLFNTAEGLDSNDKEDENNPHNNVHGRNPNEEWGVFKHLEGQQFTDFRQIRQEIVDETERLTGTKKGIHREPIQLAIYSPNVLSLTLVDLPGIAKVPVEGQPVDIEKQIIDMCKEYISNPNAIILAVTAANQDLANSDALKLAQEVDPSGNRTVGVLTKVDLMDEGTDCASILLNQVIPLRRGYTAVVNRSQKDINGELSIREGLKKEEVFFKNHPVYGRDRIILSKCGTARLAVALNNMLMHHIRDCLPDLKHRISRMMAEVQQELDALGSPTENASRSARGATLLGLLSQFSNNFSSILEGNGPKDGKRTIRHPVDELMGGARISYIFSEVFAASLSSVGPFDGLTDEEIRTTICNANGTRPALFVPEASFDILVRRQVARLEEPGVNCVDLVYEELQKIAAQAEPSALTRFPILRDRIVEVVMSLLRRCVKPTQMMVGNLVKIELAYINTSHPDFIGGAQAVAESMRKIAVENDRNRAAGIAGVVKVPASVHAPLSNSSVQNYESDVEEENISADEKPSNTGGGGVFRMLFQTDTQGTSGGGASNLIPPRAPPRSIAAATTTKNRQPRSSMGPPSMVELPGVPDALNQGDIPATVKEKQEMEVIKSLVGSYFNIVRKNFTDMVPKTIMYFLVNHVRDSLQNELVSELYREAEVGTLLQEAEDIAGQRSTMREMKDLLSRALEIVNEVRDYQSMA